MTTVRSARVASPYARLGLASGASLAEVKRAYRRLAMNFHPDRAGSESLETFLAIKAAYEWILAHPSSADPRAGRPGPARPTTGTYRVRSAPRTPARPAPPPAARSSWPGGRWYWEGIRERASRQRRDDRVD